MRKHCRVCWHSSVVHQADSWRAFAIVCPSDKYIWDVLLEHESSGGPCCQMTVDSLQVRLRVASCGECSVVDSLLCTWTIEAISGI